MEKELCINCKTEPVHIKKRKLCKNCYMKNHRADKISNTDLKKVEHKSEIEFINNYFKHNNWIYEPATFKLKHEKYTPDFYDRNRDVFIEVIGTRQAFYRNRDKYILLKELFPKIKFELRYYTGELMDINGTAYI